MYESGCVDLSLAHYCNTSSKNFFFPGLLLKHRAYLTSLSKAYANYSKNNAPPVLTQF